MPLTSRDNSNRPAHLTYNLNSSTNDSNSYQHQQQQESDSEYEVHRHYNQEEDSIPIHSTSPSPPQYQMSNFDSSISDKKRFAGGFDPYVRPTSSNGQPINPPAVIVGEDKLQEKIGLANKGKYANIIPVQKPPTSPVSITV